MEIRELNSSSDGETSNHHGQPLVLALLLAAIFALTVWQRTLVPEALTPPTQTSVAVKR